MFAAQITRPGRIELVDHAEPELGPDTPGSIIFQPRMACLCGSDLPYFTGDDGHGPYPLQPGYSLHEMVGVVVESTSPRFQPGDRVLGVPERQKGFYRRYVLDADRVIPRDSRLTAEMAVLAQPLGTVLYSHRKLDGFLGKSVVVVGQGPIGQMHALVASGAGARTIIGIDHEPLRLERSSAFGVHHTIDTSREDAVARVKELTDGRGADLVIECVGHGDQALNSCIPLARRDGTILYFGVPPETLDGVRWRDLFFRNLTVHTSVDPDFGHDFPLAMKWLAEERLDFSPLITHRFAVEEIQAAYELFRDRGEGALKIMLEFPE